MSKYDGRPIRKGIVTNMNVGTTHTTGGNFDFDFTRARNWLRNIPDLDITMPFLCLD
jgi:hypothetical protein